MPDMDAEGRFVRFDWGESSIASMYVPSGTSGELRQRVKDGFLERYLAQLAEMRHDGRSYILCGDFNIAHKAIDTFDPVRNAKVTGFLPHERAWMDDVLALGWVDAFRVVDSEPEALHLVAELARGVREQSRLAHRLPARSRRTSPVKVRAPRSIVTNVSPTTPHSRSSTISRSTRRPEAAHIPV